MSLSARRAWIEIQSHTFSSRVGEWSLSARRAWIEIHHVLASAPPVPSLSARRAWIEIVLNA